MPSGNAKSQLCALRGMGEKRKNVKGMGKFKKMKNEVNPLVMRAQPMPVWGNWKTAVPWGKMKVTDIFEHVRGT